jgi:hypothetical protein
MKLFLRRYLSAAVTTVLVLVLSVPARAQYKPRPTNDPATGESFHIEGSAGIWFPTADMTVSSQSLGILGSQISFKDDLGLTDKHLPEFQLVLRPFRSHKLRLQYIPIQYDASATLTRDVIFNGIRYRLGLPTNSSLDWKALRVGYEYDFIVKNSGFAGFILEAKYTDVTVQLASPVNSEFAHAKAPIPAIGGIARYYVVPNISITGELTGFKIPDSVNNQYNAHYVDIDVYGTLNLTNNIGAQAGYRSLDLGYLVKTDSGSFVLRGLYFGAVLRY